MKNKRLKRLNSLLKEVISEVILKDINNPNISKLISITQVDISPDLHFAKVSVSVIGEDSEKQKTIDALNTAAKFISFHASKKVDIRYFPALTFQLDTSVDKHLKIEEILKDIHKEQESR
jgi:ribosome-binding factor A